ncbi:MAG TPA: hypothetical protein VGL99_27485 [Chloroflexota bacterium]|jgi:hypothetical protein
MSRWFVGVALIAASVLLPAPTTLAQGTTSCTAGQAPRFMFGFADLKAHIGEAMGEPVTCEFSDPNGTGDVHQRTTSGLAFWRKSTNTPTFTNGFEHWANTPAGWVTWTGAGIDPPRQVDAYPQVVVDGFMSGCRGTDPQREPICRCAIDKIQARLSLVDFINLSQRLMNDEPDEQLTTIVVECILEAD